MLKWVYEFNQEKLLALQAEKHKINPSDVLILHSIVNSVCSVKMQTIFEDNRVYVWIDYGYLLESLPILNIGSRQLIGLIKKYKELNLIHTKKITNHNARGSKSFIALSDKLINCLSDNAKEHYNEKLEVYIDREQMKKIAVESKPSAKNVSSDNKQYSKNNKELSKDNSNSISKKQQFDFGKRNSKQKKSTKKATYQDCLQSIYNYTDDEKLRTALSDYLNLRLSMMKEKPMKMVQWFTMLDKLTDEHKKSSSDVTKLDIVRRAIERGYTSFYAINNYSYSSGTVKNKPWEQGVKSETYTEEEKRQIEKERAEREARGEQVWY